MYINKHTFIEPQHFSVPAPWAGHIPFVSWLISQMKPSSFVELGTYSGISYMAICQAIKEVGCNTKAWAIDTWQGDPHAGMYTEDIFTKFKNAHDAAEIGFSSYLRMTFEEAIDKFDDNSIDLLHIDGMHTYDAVANDFYTWLPKLTKKAIVLFHDTHVFRDDFGVHKLWGELVKSYPSCEFTHSNGLGVLFVGTDQPEIFSKISNVANGRELREIYEKIGRRFELRAALALQQNDLQNLQTNYDREFEAGKVRHDWIVKQDALISDLNNEKGRLSTLCQELEGNALNLSKKIEQHVNDLEQNKREILRLQSDLKQSEIRSNEFKILYTKVLGSISWKITKPIRFFGRLTRFEFHEAFYFLRCNMFFASIESNLIRVTKVFRYLARGDVKGLLERVRYYKKETLRKVAQEKLADNSTLNICVVTPGHTNFVAQLIAERLAFHGWNTRITNEMPDKFHDDLYVVLCPQIFSKLPPGEKRIVYQLEQSVSSRWFDKKYFDILENSLVVLDYSLVNIQYLSSKGIAYPHITYLPIGAINGFGKKTVPSGSSPEVLFYGDSFSSARRQKMLAVLREHFNLEVVNNLFGEDMITRLKSAKVVINLHYYENALLEMPRIQECLSLGIPVVSEATQDQNEYPELDGAVIFFEEGSTSGMIDAVRMALDGSCIGINKSVSVSSHKFEFMFDRFLVSMGLLPSSYVTNMTLPLPKDKNIFGLSMPETIERRKLFLNMKPKNCHVFDGIRMKPGWVGCGLSYTTLARHAKTNNIATLTVMEDDVILPDDFDNKLESINRFLSSKQGGWDVFSGVIAVLNPDVEIIDVEDFEGQRFVTIDKMISMVFNIYAKSAIDIFANWNPENLNSENNTIDKYLESQKNIKVVTTLPFLVGHREEVHSTLWGFQNTTYVEMIANSQSLLEAKVAEFLAKQ
jgi:hypothetical protein